MAMDKLRTDFEADFENETGWSAGDYPSQEVVDLCWRLYQQSRASIVVDTPQLCGDGENDSEYTDGYNDGITATEKTIRSIGLSIKEE
ncbi:hypothetical protein D3C80_1350760 [compost metagenome]